MAPRLISTTRTSGGRTGYLMFRPDYSRLFYQETFDTEKFCSHPRQLLQSPAQKQTSSRWCWPTRLSQEFRAKRDNKLTNLTAWIASFVRVPCR
jgi:hypothetical protein